MKRLTFSFVLGLLLGLLVAQPDAQVAIRKGYIFTAGLFNFTDADGTPDFNIHVGGAPALSTCGDGALQTGSSNSSGRVVGTTQTACTLTFSSSFGGNAADCVFQNLIAARGFVSAASSTAMTVTGLTAGDDFIYHCFGR